MLYDTCVVGGRLPAVEGARRRLVCGHERLGCDGHRHPAVKEVEKRGVRAWCWSDKIWHAKDEFLKRMPKSVLQSNWYYGLSQIDLDKPQDRKEYGNAYLWLDEAGFDQVPTGSNWSTPENMAATAKFIKKTCKPENIRGFLAAPWVKTLPQFEKLHEEQVDQVVEARALYASRVES